MNWIPVVSQAKSIFQLAWGDTAGAWQTQKDFLQECPIVSQGTSVVQLVTGDTEGALETQQKCGNMLLRTADGIPLVGHGKSAVHYACGDTEGAYRSWMSATRTTAAMGGGIAGFAVGGPVGAVAGGIAGAGAMDTTLTAVDSLAEGEYTPTGYYAAVDNLIKNPNPGAFFDTAMMTVGDGWAGYGGAKLAGQMDGSSGGAQGPTDNPGGPPSATVLSQANALEAQAAAMLETAESGKMTMTTGEYINAANEAKGVWQNAQTLKGVSDTASNLKVQPSPAGGGAVPIPFDGSSRVAHDGSEFCVSIEQFVIWETDTLAVIGNSKFNVELTSALLHWDLETVNQLCKGANMQGLHELVSTATRPEILQHLLLKAPSDTFFLSFFLS